MGSAFSRKWAEDRSVRRRLPALLLAMLGVALTLAPALVSAQVAGLGVAIAPAFDGPVTVGEQDRPALIQFTNRSFGPQAAIDPVTLTNIVINTSCDTVTVIADPAGPSLCPTPEPRPDPTQPVLDLDGTSVAGTTCPGGPFLITGPDAEGDHTVTPTTGPLTLAPVGQPGSSCVIAFTFDVVQRPFDGETFAPVALVATSPTFPVGAPQAGVSQSEATVRITDLPPTVTVVKTADPPSRPEPGGSFRFTLVVTNTSAEAVTITSLLDDVYGDLNGKGSCAVGIKLPPGASYSCAFDGTFTGVSGQSQTDIVTVTVVDDDNTTARDDDDAVVTLTPPVSSPPTTVPPPPQRSPLVRTGSELAGPARIAGLMLLFGMALVAATRRYGDEGPGLATVGAGPGSGPRGGGGGLGGLRFDGGNPFGRGHRNDPPRLPQGGGGAALAQSPTPPAAEPEAQAAPAPELSWDDWVGADWPTAPALEATVVEPAFVEPVQPIIIEPGGDGPGSVEPVVPGPHVEPMPVEPSPEPETVAAATEVLVPTVVPNVRSTNGLDAAALDAADAFASPTGPAGPPSGRRRRR